jgi:osmotically-inducible protein OsmY
MNFPIFKRVFPKAMAWAGLAALCGVMALAQTTPVAPPPAPVDSSNGVRTDSQIEMEVVHALDDAQKLKGDLITAATIQGEVTLSGTVSSNSNRKLANSIAKHVQGVTKVYDNLKVGNPQEPQATQAEVYPGNQQPPEN